MQCANVNCLTICGCTFINDVRLFWKKAYCMISCYLSLLLLGLRSTFPLCLGVLRPISVCVMASLVRHISKGCILPVFIVYVHWNMFYIWCQVCLEYHKALGYWAFSVLLSLWNIWVFWALSVWLLGCFAWGLSERTIKDSSPLKRLFRLISDVLEILYHLQMQETELLPR